MKSEKKKAKSTKRKSRLRDFSFWRRHPDLNWGIKVLQTSALPLGYDAVLNFVCLLFSLYIIPYVLWFVKTVSCEIYVSLIVCFVEFAILCEFPLFFLAFFAYIWYNLWWQITADTEKYSKGSYNCLLTHQQANSSKKSLPQGRLWSLFFAL